MSGILKAVIFYHNDMDGICSRVIMERYIRDTYTNYWIRTFELNHSSADRDKIATITEGELAIFVDYAFSENTLDVFKEVYEKTEHCKNFIWIDHHDSSLRFVNRYVYGEPDEDGKVSNIIFDLPQQSYLISKSGSGAYLTWAYTHNLHFCRIETIEVGERKFNYIKARDMYAAIQFVPPAVRYVSDYDTFAHRLNPETDHFKLGYDAKDDKYGFMHYLFVFISNWDDNDTQSEFPLRQRHLNDCEDAINTGKIIMKYITSENARVLKASGYESILPDIDGTGVENIYVCNRMTNSWVFGDLYDKYKYVVIWFFDGSEYRYSIFSNLNLFPDANCEKYAIKFGGGGHNGAAGWRGKKLMFEEGIFVVVNDSAQTNDGTSL